MSKSKPTLSLVPKNATDDTQSLAYAKPERVKQEHAEPSIELSIEALYSTFRPSLFNYLLSLCPGGQEEAVDILHETYLRLLRLDDLGHLQQNPRAYVFTIATNLARDAMRRRSTRKTDAHDEFDELEFTSLEPTPTEVFDWGRSLERLKQSLSSLPELTRKIFVHSRFDEMTYTQIAQQLKISTRTVERHMSNAMRTLQNSFDDVL